MARATTMKKKVGPGPVQKKSMKKAKRGAKAAVQPKMAASASKKKKGGGRTGPKKNPKCVECQSVASCASGFVHHLHKAHHTSLRKYGIYLICGCGIEIRTRPEKEKVHKCAINSFTIHHVDKKSSTQCILCETHPSTPYGYAHHLKRFHKSTLSDNGIYLICACGKEIHSIRYDPDHVKDCKGQPFTVQRIKTTPANRPVRGAPAKPRSTRSTRQVVVSDNEEDENEEKEENDGEEAADAMMEVEEEAEVLANDNLHEDIDEEEEAEDTVDEGDEDRHEVEEMGDEESEGEDESDGDEASVGDEEEMEEEDEMANENLHEDEEEESDEEPEENTNQKPEDTVETGDEERLGEAVRDKKGGVDQNEYVDVETVDHEEETLHEDEEEERNEQPEDDIVENGDEERLGEAVGDKKEGVDQNEYVDVVAVDDAEKVEHHAEPVYCHYPAKIGDVINEKYLVDSMIGEGRFATTWLCKEAKTNRSFAVKIAVSNAVIAKMAEKEIEMLSNISERDASDPHKDKVLQLLDSFTLNGDTGRHLCAVFEKLDCNVLQLVADSDYRGIGIEKVKTVIRQVLEGLDYMHTKCNIIHTDIKPENILLSMENNEIKQVHIADLRNACYTDKHLMDLIQTLEYRSPEVLICADYSITADIWSTACVAFELATGDYLFEPKEGKDGKGKKCSSEADLLMKITNMLGPIPAEVYKKGKKWADFYNKEGQSLHVQNVESLSLMERLLQDYHWNDDDASQFVSFLTPMLEVDHENRATAAKCLHHEWLQLGAERPAPAAAEGEEAAAQAE